MNLHNQIMNLPCKETSFASRLQEAAYKFGHRDARHSAAELACEHDKEMREWMEACRAAVRDRDRLSYENTDLRKRAHCWDMIYSMIHAMHEAGISNELTPDEVTNAYIDAWQRQKRRIEELEAQVAKYESKDLRQPAHSTGD